jgi:hypothetical protein
MIKMKYSLIGILVLLSASAVLAVDHTHPGAKV